MLISVVVSIIIYCSPVKRKLTKISFLSLSFLSFYLSFVSTITVISRNKSNSSQYNLSVFWTYIAIAGGRTGLVLEIIWNIILFIPIGILLMLVITHKDKGVIAILLGLLLSVSIEVIQLLSYRGLFEFDDIIHNTLGTAIGVGILYFVSSIINLLKHNSK